MTIISVYPVFLQIAGRKCVIIGGGRIGERRAKKLLKNRAKVSVISKDFTRPLLKMASKVGRERLYLIQKEYGYGDIPGDALLVFECVGDEKIAESIAKECKEKKLLFNSSSCPHLSDFLVPASVKRGNLEIAISTYGKTPSVSRALREKIEEVLPKELSKKTAFLESLRKKLKSKNKKTKRDDLLLMKISRILFDRPEISFKRFQDLAERELKKELRHETRRSSDVSVPPARTST